MKFDLALRLDLQLAPDHTVQADKNITWRPPNLLQFVVSRSNRAFQSRVFLWQRPTPIVLPLCMRILVLTYAIFSFGSRSRKKADVWRNGGRAPSSYIELCVFILFDAYLRVCVIIETDLLVCNLLSTSDCQPLFHDFRETDVQLLALPPKLLNWQCKYIAFCVWDFGFAVQILVRINNLILSKFSSIDFHDLLLQKYTFNRN